MRVILLVFTKLIILRRMDVEILLRLKMYHWLENILFAIRYYVNKFSSNHKNESYGIILKY